MTRAAENHFQTKTAITADKKLLPQALPTLLLHTGMRFFRTSIYFMLILLGALFILLNLNPNECSAETWHRVAASDTITYSIDLDTVETHTSAAGPSTSAWIKYEYADRSFLIEYVQATPARANTLTTHAWYNYDARGNSLGTGDSQGKAQHFAAGTYGEAIYNSLLLHA